MSKKIITLLIVAALAIPMSVSAEQKSDSAGYDSQSQESINDTITNTDDIPAENTSDDDETDEDVSEDTSDDTLTDEDVNEDSSDDALTDENEANSQKPCRPQNYNKPQRPHKNNRHNKPLKPVKPMCPSVPDDTEIPEGTPAPDDTKRPICPVKPEPTEVPEAIPEVTDEPIETPLPDDADETTDESEKPMRTEKDKNEVKNKFNKWIKEYFHYIKDFTEVSDNISD